jgi:hypothetical protein
MTTYSKRLQSPAPREIALLGSARLEISIEKHLVFRYCYGRAFGDVVLQTQRVIGEHFRFARA